MASNDDDPVELTIDGHEVAISHPDKVFFSRDGITKLGLVEFYLAIAEPLMRAMRNRPTMMQRFPDGASGKSFYQKRVTASHPEWLSTTTVATVNGTESNALVLVDMAHVAWAVNQGVLGFHPWPFRVTPGQQHEQWPVDELRIDLDPQPGCSFDMVREAAAETRDFFVEIGMRSFAKTTGSKGLHIHVPVTDGYDSYQVRAAAVTVARRLAQRRPDLVTDAWWKEERGERVFVDFNQNAPHKTVFGAWSVRARVGAQVSTPFRWDEIETIDPETTTVTTVPDRVASLGDPWEEMSDVAFSIDELIDEWQTTIDEGGFDAPWPPVYPKMPHEPPRVAPSRAKPAPDSDG